MVYRASILNYYKFPTNSLSDKLPALYISLLKGKSNTDCEDKLPCFCPISVGNHTVSDETQTHTPIEKITPQKVAKNFYTPLREKGNQNRDL